MIKEVKKEHKILIVDDVPHNIQVLANILKEAGYRLGFAKDGDAALTHMKSAKFDLILLDIMMPGIDGFEVCRILRNQEETANLPIIMLSARADAESVNRGLLLGATKYLTKPVMPDELTRHVREVLNVSDGIA